MEKMSKSKNNGLDPEELTKEYGVDAARLFTLFAAPPEKELEWNMNGVMGAYRFISRIYNIVEETGEILSKDYDDIDIEKRSKENENLQRKVHKTIKKVTESMEDNFHFNTAIAATMELLNEISSYKQNVLDKSEKSSESNKIFKEAVVSMVLMISPFTPYIAEELWEKLGNKGYIYNVKWPEYVEKLTHSSEITMVIQINGKLRSEMQVSANISKEEAEKLALENEKISQLIEGKTIVKVIVVPKKLVNVVIR